MRTSTISLLLSGLLLAFSVAHAEQQRGGALQPIDAMVPSKYDFGLPSWAPKPLEPASNPTNPAKVELGRYLFYDTRLSRDGSYAPFVAGDVVPVTLVFEKAGRIDVKISVVPLGGETGGHNH